MYLSRLALTNYRNFRSLEVEPPPGTVFILGANAQGKSNLLEAAYLLAIAKSYRTNTERELIHRDALQETDTLPEDPPIRPGSPGLSTPTSRGMSEASPERTGFGSGQALITGEAELKEGHLRVIVGLQATAGQGGGGWLVKKQIRVNGVATTAAGLVGWLNAVLFTATDIDLTYGSPSVRRRFLDILISQADRTYLRALQRYQRVVTQRNHLLRLIRDGRGSREELDFWDAELVKEGVAIITRRDQVIERLAPLATQAYAGLVGGQEELSLVFQPAVPAPGLEEALREQREREIAAGMTLSGPHRDDLALEVEGMSAAIYASRGQARTIALALRLAEALFLKETRGEEPVLLLDDVLSELDPQRRRHVLEEAGRYQQTLITTAEPALAQDAPVRPSAVFTVHQGRVTQS